MIGDETSTMHSKYSIHSHVLGQGDATEQKSSEITNPIIEQSRSNSEQKPSTCHYSISQLLDRYEKKS